MAGIKSRIEALEALIGGQGDDDSPPPPPVLSADPIVASYQYQRYVQWRPRTPPRQDLDRDTAITAEEAARVYHEIMQGIHAPTPPVLPAVPNIADAGAYGPDVQRSADSAACAQRGEEPQ